MSTVLAAAALAVALAALALAVAVMRQSATAVTAIRRHRTAHDRTHGRPDPDPEHHGTSPTVKRLAAEVDELASYVAALGEWADGIQRRLAPPQPDAEPEPVPAPSEAQGGSGTASPAAVGGPSDPLPPTEAMPAMPRPEVRP